MERGLTRYPESPQCMHHLGIIPVLLIASSRDLSRSLFASSSPHCQALNFAFAFRTLSELRISNSAPKRDRSISFFLSLSLSQSIFPFFSCSLPNTRNPIAHTWPKYTHTHVLELGEHTQQHSIGPSPLKRPADPPSASLGNLVRGNKEPGPRKRAAATPFHRAGIPYKTRQRI